MSFVRTACFGLTAFIGTSFIPSQTATAGEHPGPPSPPPRFRVLVLPNFEGGNSSAANDINDSGQVAGAATTPGTGYPNAVTWIDGKLINITGEGVSGAFSNAVNSDGTVVGSSDSLGLSAFSWNNGVLTPLMNPMQCCSAGMGINDAGLITGNASLSGPNTPNDGALWDNGVVIPLGTLGGTLCHPQDINASGQIVGMSDIANNGEYFAFVWQDGVMKPLPTLGGGWNGANGISDSGVAVGFIAPVGIGQMAVKWVDGEVIPLASLGGPLSGAADINENGWIVGNAWVSPQAGSTAALWIDNGRTGDQVFDLELRSLIQPGDQLYDARGVNESGQIVGEGFFMDGSKGLPGGEFHGFVLTPLRPGDVDGDDVVNVADLLGVIGDWGACPAPHAVATCPGDLDSDGAVNVIDLLRVIGDWG